ncbi:MAG TPA: glycosyltransferase family 39 protein [Candidatus Binatia bacterium]
MRRLVGGLLLVVLVGLVLRLVAAWAIPLGHGEAFNCAPDEAGHFWAARELGRGDATTWPANDSIYSVYPPAPYAAHAALYALLVPRADRAWMYREPPALERIQGYPLVRLGSVLLGALTVWLLGLAAHAWTRSRSAALVTGAVAALYPQLVFVDAYTNGDAYTVAAGAWLALALARWARAGEGDAGLGLVGLASGAVVLGKPGGYALLAATLGWLLWAGWRGRMGRGAALRALAAALVLAGPVLAWNAVRNGGDPLGLVRYHAFLGGPYRPTAIADVPRPVATFVRLLASSAFGRFANMSLPLPSPVPATALLLLLVGLAAAAASLPAADGAARRGAVWLAASSALAVALVALNSWRVDFQPQGRYVLSSAVMLTAVATWAPSRLRGRAWRLWPALYLALLAVAALETELLLLRHPCG